MEDLLSRPEVQTAAAPLVVSFVFALVFRNRILSVLSLVAGFTAAAWLITDLILTPLTSTRKILMVFWIAALLGFLSDALSIRSTGRRILILLGAVVSTAWVFQNLLMRSTMEEAAMWFVPLAAAVLWHAIWHDVIAHADTSHSGIRAAASVFAVALGTGIVCVLGSSALLGQLAVALGVAASGVLLISLFGGRFNVGSGYVWAGSVTAALIGVAAYKLASLSWQPLVAILAVPLFARFTPLPSSRPAATIVAGILCLIPAAVAVALTWGLAEPSSGYG